MPYHHLEVIQSKTEQLCPRVELLPENSLPAALALVASKVGLNESVFRLYFDIQTGHLTPQERQWTLDAVLLALGNEDVSGRIEAAREAARARARAEAE